MYPGCRLGSAEDLWMFGTATRRVCASNRSDQIGPLFPLSDSDAANAVDSLWSK